MNGDREGKQTFILSSNKQRESVATSGGINHPQATAVDSNQQITTSDSSNKCWRKAVPMAASSRKWR